ncbi:hypothetical protein OC195_10435 [Priestia flexa]|nr:hypothetical protein OC195_10435 [Priestia flexa]
MHQLAATYDMWVHADAAYGGGTCCFQKLIDT